MAYSPMIVHYLQTKEKYSDCILLYRLGDFYEMFFDDAQEASEILNLVLTGRDCGDGQRAPMCGVPYHAVDNYIQKLISAGKKVAICEQLTDPKKGGREMVERGVIRVITAGTVMEESLLDEKRNNYLACVYSGEKSIACAVCDITTGEVVVSDFHQTDMVKQLQSFLIAYEPSEIISNSYSLYLNDSLDCILSNTITHIVPYHDWAFQLKKAQMKIISQYNLNCLNSFGIEKLPNAVIAVGALLEYLTETQMRALTHLKNVKLLSNDNFLSMDISTRRNLEIVSSGKDNVKKGSLLWLLDQTRTSMGGRLLTNWVDRPLQDVTEINDRLNGVEELINDYELRDRLNVLLFSVKDIERISAKISYNNFTPRDCNSLQASLLVLPEIKKAIANAKSKILCLIKNNLVDMTKLERILYSAIVENAPIITRDGDFIKRGYCAELDKLSDISINSKSLIASLEANERERTGIKTLKVGYNRVFGYYFELSNSYKSMAPLDYIRKQTLTNGERYVSPELKNLEDEILNADEKSLQLEKELFDKLRQTILEYIPDLQKVAANIARLDVILSFAKVSNEHNYCKPIVNVKDSSLQIVDGRHPTVEAHMKSGEFIANDTMLDGEQNRTMVITGPNMAGKSTYMRQVALIVLMAHLGCFVPAKSANVPIVDRIFTRVGASDDLAFNQSTFMVEMVEVANIVNNATDKSLIILDEVGRGTATFDGLSIAWAVLEYISNNLKAKTLFATHFHELTELEGTVEGVKNYKISVKELNDKIVFLRKITRGGASKSFGIQVAALAGIPKAITDRAKQIVGMLEQSDINYSIRQLSQSNLVENEQETAKNKTALQLYSELKDVNMDNVTPMQAFEILNELVQKVNK